LKYRYINKVNEIYVYKIVLTLQTWFRVDGASCINKVLPTYPTYLTSISYQWLRLILSSVNYALSLR